MTVEPGDETSGPSAFGRRLGLGVGVLSIVGWAWYWGVLSDMGFSDTAINRGRGGLSVLAVGVVGAVIGLRWLKVSRPVKWVIFVIAMLVPGLILFDWLRSLARM